MMKVIGECHISWKLKQAESKSAHAFSPHFSQDGEIIAQGFGFTGDFLDEWNNSVYCRVQKIPCRSKEQPRIRYSCEKYGLVIR